MNSLMVITGPASEAQEKSLLYSHNPNFSFWFKICSLCLLPSNEKSKVLKRKYDIGFCVLKMGTWGMYTHIFLYQHLKDTLEKLPPRSRSGLRGEIFHCIPLYIFLIPHQRITYCKNKNGCSLHSSSNFTVCLKIFS